MIEVSSLSVTYGKAIALSDVDMVVAPATVTAIVGANGAGKSSLGRAVGGLTPSRGTITWDGETISGLSAEARVKRGIVYVPEGRMVFKQLSVEDNLKAGAYTVRRTQDWQAKMDSIFERVPRLAERRAIKAGLLSGGEQQLLAIGRALMAFPKVVIFDEPSLGLSPIAIAVVEEFLDSLVKDDQLTVLLLEQNVSLASRLARRAYVLALGEVVREIDEAELLEPERARAALVDAIE